MLANTSPLPVSVKSVSPYFSNQSCTYFRGSEVAPEFVDGELNVYNGKGTRRSWGQAQVSSDVSLLTPNIIKVAVTGWHKHTVSPVGGNYYFVFENGQWVRRTANYKVVKAALATA